MEISPKEYGLSSNVKLKLIDDNHMAIVKLVKSRIIQKDAKKLIEMARKIKEKKAGVKVCLICNNNICSKSVKLLNESNIEVMISD